jgi:hypothetical protein
MTGDRDGPDPAARWRATIDALEAVLQAAPDEPELDTAEAADVRHLIAMRLAAARRDNLPAAWVRRPGIFPRIVADAVTPETTEPTAPTPPSPHPPTRPRPAWHE